MNKNYEKCKVKVPVSLSNIKYTENKILTYVVTIILLTNMIYTTQYLQSAGNTNGFANLMMHQVQLHAY